MEFDFLAQHKVLLYDNSMQHIRNLIDNDLLLKRDRKRDEDVRGAYYRDMTAIIHSSPFSRLKHKTQVFFAPANDHICTRMEHVLHVASIASTICRPFGLDSELAWAIGMGHDLGHTPFGHVGERIISSMSQERGFGNFEHEVNSLRVVRSLCNHGKGLNLTYAVQDGIVSHCGEHFLMRYLGRDYEDARRLGILDGAPPLPLEVRKMLGDRNSTIINTLVNDIISSTSQDEGMGFSREVYEAVLEMKDYNYRNIYRSELLAGYTGYFTRLLNLIVNYLDGLLSSYGCDKKGYDDEKNMLAAGFYAHLMELKDLYIEKEGSTMRLVLDYVAGMSDNFALDCANEILKPEHLNDRIEQSQRGKWFDV